MAAKNPSTIYTATVLNANISQVLNKPQSQSVIIPITTVTPITQPKTIGQLWPRGNK